VLSSTVKNEENPQFKGKVSEEDANIYIYWQKSCKAPVKSIQQAQSLLKLKKPE
jgi:hypothetical protein